MRLKFILSVLLSSFALGAVAFINIQPTQISHFKPFLVMLAVTCILATLAYRQRYRQR